MFEFLLTLELSSPFVAEPAQSPLDIRRCVAVWLRIMRSHSVTDDSATVFQALADPTRRAVLDLLRLDTLPAGQIALSFPVSRPAISKHLRLLRRANLVREHRRGRLRLYRLNPQPLQAVDQWLSQYRAFWSTKLVHLKTFVESGNASGRADKLASVRVKRKTQRWRPL